MYRVFPLNVWGWLWAMQLLLKIYQTLDYSPYTETLKGLAAKLVGTAYVCNPISAYTRGDTYGRTVIIGVVDWSMARVVPASETLARI